MGRLLLCVCFYLFHPRPDQYNATGQVLTLGHFSTVFASHKRRSIVIVRNNGRLGDHILNAEETPLRVCTPILPMTKAWPDHLNLSLG